MKIMDGYIYVFRDQLNNNLIKVGLSKQPITRIKQLHTTGTALPFSLWHAWWVSDMRTAERIAHNRLADHRINPRRELFFIAPRKDFSEFEQNNYETTSVFLNTLTELIEVDFCKGGIAYREVDLQKFWDAYFNGEIT